MKEQLKKADLFGLAIIAATLITYSTRSVWTIYQTIAAVVGGLLVVVSIALKLPEIRAGLGRRSSRYGINSATSVVLVLGILAFVNYLGAQHSKRLDMTSEKVFTLSDQSIRVAGQVKEDVHIKAFYPGGEYPPDRDLLRLYTNRNNKIAVEFIDPDNQPQIAQQYQVTAYGTTRNPMTGESTRYGTLILEKGAKSERIEKQGSGLKEEDITNALLKLVKGVQKTIYFTEGHGEKQINSADERSGYQFAKNGLEKENYVVKTINLIQENKIPEDASVVAMVGPTTEPLAGELDALDAYLNGGGNVLLMLDPPPAASLKDFLTKWSIDAGSNFVVDISGVGKLFGAGPTIPVVTKYGGHRITQSFNGVMTFFPLARSIYPAKPPVSGIVVEPLLQTSENSWGESDTKPGEKKVQFDDKVDIKGPVTIAAVATKTIGEKKGRFIVFGDSDFAVNAYFGVLGNGNLFTNTVSYLAQDESFISIKAKDPANRPVTMNEAQEKTVAWLVELLLPGSVLAVGISVWMKRRK